MRTLDEHHKLARVALRFGPKLDDAFKINVAKMRVQLPAQLRANLEKLLVPVINAANSEYRQGGSGKSPPSPSAKPAPTSPPAQSASVAPSATVVSEETKKYDGAPLPVIKSLHTLDEIKQRLLTIAGNDEKPIIERLFDRLTLGGNR